MTKRKYDIQLPAQLNSPGVPEELRQQIQTKLPFYQNEATALSPAEQHPAITAFKGLLRYGPGGLTLPGVVENYANERRANAVKAFDDYVKNSITQQKSFDDLSADRNVLAQRQTMLDALRNSRHDEQGNATGLPIGTPDLYPRTLPPLTDEKGTVISGNPNGGKQSIPYIPAAESEKMFKQLAGSSDTGLQMQLMPQVAQQAMGLFHPPSGSGTLQAGVTQQDINLPPVIADPQTLQNNLAEVFKTGLTQGQSKYQFDEQKPQRDAEEKKTLAEWKEALARQDQIKADTAYKKLMSIWYPKKTQSEINRNNRPPAGSAQNPLTQAAQLQAILKNKRDAWLNDATLQGFYDPKKQQFITPGNEGAVFGFGGHPNVAKMAQFSQLKNAIESLNAQIGGYGTAPAPNPGKPANPQFQSTPGQAPSVVPGKHGTYVF